MDKKIERTIQNMYKAILIDRRTKKHRFLTDIESVDMIRQRQEQYNNIEYGITNSEYKKYIKVAEKKKKKLFKKECNEKNKWKNHLSKEEITHYIENIRNSTSKEEFIETCNSLFEYKLPGTIQSISDIEHSFIEKDKYTTLNILIIGGGPNGMFLANYLHKLYNENPSNLKVNIIMLENRIEKENVRYPFTRNRYFAIITRYLEIVLPHLYCKFTKKSNSGILIPIKYLELALYAETYYHQIPLLFTKKYEKWNQIEKLIKKLDIDVVFDCTGNRLDKIPLQPNQPMFENVKMNIVSNSLPYEFHIYEKENIVTLSLNGFYDKWINIEYYDHIKKMVIPVTFEVKNESDYKLCHHVCLSKNDFFHFIPYIKDEELKKLMMGLYIKQLQKIHPHDMITINTFTVNMYHRLKITEFVHMGKHSYFYIGAGDTIFSSHYVVGSGLNRTILLSIKICHLLPLLLPSF